MSVFVVTDTHISTLLSYGNARGAYYRDGEKSCNLCELEPRELTAIGQMLLFENVKSYNIRYRQSEMPHTYQFARTKILSPVQIIKSCECYKYECSEDNFYENTQACKIVNAIKRTAISKIPGYDEAEWGIPDTTHTVETITI